MKRTPLKRKGSLRMKSRRRAVPKEIKDHWDRVAKLGCIVTKSPICTIHHVHGGSVRELYGEQAMPGVGQKQNDWLVIPISPQLHTGTLGIDGSMGVKEWEAINGKQTDLLREVRNEIKRLYGYCIYERAGLSGAT